jgi:two-component system, LuxR family, response regulator FixJ
MGTYGAMLERTPHRTAHRGVELLATEPTVFLVDDDPEMLKAIARTVASAGWPVQTYLSGEAFLSAYAPSQGGCVVLDLRMPHVSGLRVQEMLIARNARIPVIFITGYGKVAAAVQAMKAGAMDFLEKPFSEQVLLDCIEHAMAHDAQRRQEQAWHTTFAARLARLTPREREVLDLVLAGLLNKEIALRLAISQRTVELHRSRIMQKLHAESAADLARQVLWAQGA